MILVTGSDFTGTTGITFGATNAPTFTVISDTEIVVTVPAVTAAGSNLITITNGTGPNTTGKKYTYKAPTVTKVSPNYALEDAAKWVTITGTGFTGSVAADVVIGGTAANAILIISDKKLLAQTATSASKGQGNVVLTRSSVASATSNSNYFLYDDAVPVVSYLNGSGSGSGSQLVFCRIGRILFEHPNSCKLIGSRPKRLPSRRLVPFGHGQVGLLIIGSIDGTGIKL